MLLESHEEALELTEAISQVGARANSKAAADWRRRAVKRLEDLYATLGMDTSDAQALVADDAAAAQKGELPEWLKKRVHAPPSASPTEARENPAERLKAQYATLERGGRGRPPVTRRDPRHGRD